MSLAQASHLLSEHLERVNIKVGINNRDHHDVMWHCDSGAPCAAPSGRSVAAVQPGCSSSPSWWGGSAAARGWWQRWHCVSGAPAAQWSFALACRGSPCVLGPSLSRQTLSTPCSGTFEGPRRDAAMGCGIAAYGGGSGDVVTADWLVSLRLGGSGGPAAMQQMAGEGGAQQFASSSGMVAAETLRQQVGTHHSGWVAAGAHTRCSRCLFGELTSTLPHRLMVVWI